MQGKVSIVRLVGGGTRYINDASPLTKRVPATRCLHHLLEKDLPVLYSGTQNLDQAIS
jgi:hypothetical protein